MNGKVFFLAVVFAVAIEESLSIKCHQCNTEQAKRDGKKCPEDYPASNCSSTDHKLCRKIEQEINIDKEDTVRTIYQCAEKVSGSEADVNVKCLERTGTYRFKSWYCECNTDGCNSAGTATVSIFLSTVALIFSFHRYL